MANVSSSNGLEKRPKLRFPGFDEPYRLTQLGDIASLVNRIDPKSNAPIMMLSAGNGFIMQSEKYSRDNAGQSLKKYILLKQGELAYNHGASKAKQFGCCYELTEPEARIPYVYHCFKINEHEYTPYIAMTLNNPKMDKQLKRLVSSSVRMDGLLNISFEDYMSVSLHLPSTNEQKRIANFIQKIDERIVAQEKLLASLKKYKRGVTAKLITAIEEKYPVVKLGNYVAVMRGGSPRPIDAYITNAENGIRWIKIGDAQPDQLYISDTKEKIKPEGAKKSRRVYAGDLILSNSMSFGRPYILKVDGCIHDGWLLIRDEGKKFDKRFLCFYLASDATLAQYKKYAAGSCVNNLNSELVASVEIGMPPIEQQIRVANILEKIDRQVEAASTMYSLLSKLRSFLLQQLFI